MATNKKKITELTEATSIANNAIVTIADPATGQIQRTTFAKLKAALPGHTTGSVLGCTDIPSREELIKSGDISSDPTEAEYFSKILEILMERYNYGVFVGAAKPTGMGIVLIHIYYDSTNKDGGLPRYASGTFFPLSSTSSVVRFGSYEHKFNMAKISATAMWGGVKSCASMVSVAVCIMLLKTIMDMATKTKKLQAGIPIVSADGTITPTAINALAKEVGKSLGIQTSGYGIAKQGWYRIAEMNISTIGQFLISNQYEHLMSRNLALIVTPQFMATTPSVIVQLAGHNTLFSKIRIVAPLNKNDSKEKGIELYYNCPDSNPVYIHLTLSNPAGGTLMGSLTEGFIPDGYSSHEVELSEITRTVWGGVKDCYSALCEKGGRHDEDEKTFRSAAASLLAERAKKARSNKRLRRGCRTRSIHSAGIILESAAKHITLWDANSIRIIAIHSSGVDKLFHRNGRFNLHSYARRKGSVASLGENCCFLIGRKEVIAA